VATIPVDIFVNPAHSRFITSATNAAQPTLPTPTAGDTWAISLYWLDDGPGGATPFLYHRYPTAISALRFRAVGNSHTYASGDNNTGTVTEIGPANEAVVITETQHGVHNSPSLQEKQKVKLPAVPVSGSYVLNFPGPTIFGAPSGVCAPKGSVTIQSGWSITQIRDAIRSLPFYTVFSSQLFSSPGYEQYLSVTGSSDEYTINYQTSGGDRPGPIELVSISSDALTYAYGWTFALPLTDADFADYLIPANGPSYFQALLDGTVLASLQLTAGGSGNTVPAFTNGPPGASAQLGVAYSFSYITSGFPAATFAVTSGSLPTGLSLSSAGVISGTPSATGTFSGVVTATNAAGSVTQTFLIIVSLTGGPPSPSSAGVYYDGNFSDAVPVSEIRFVAHPLPAQANAVVLRQTFWPARTLTSSTNPSSRTSEAAS